MMPPTRSTSYARRDMYVASGCASSATNSAGGGERGEGEKRGDLEREGAKRGCTYVYMLVDCRMSKCRLQTVDYGAGAGAIRRKRERT